ncbi:acyl-coA-binding protein [Penicillium capsulatum]|uniref:Acyl-coA-binding protein n=1 Tax=Penicillium capsulatum TaxID=69766 RepID=A0A9W9IBU2_9EURO|nr:acyl-coA-binding protein [Penicillium capsulatum]KAJ6135309.1 acyl-coA-binding protein [Penicillium capsulatum]
MTSAEFDEAAEAVKGLSQASTDQKLALYGLFKQAKEGDCNTSRPGAFDFAGKAKWDAWDKNRGMSQEEAEKKYIELVKELLAADGKA